jgi:hypothetical protein
VFLHVAITEKSGAVVERTGTGSIISGSGYVLTSYHVVMKNAQDGAGDPIITGAPGSAEAERKGMLVIKTEASQDLVLLKFKDTSKPWSSVKIDDPDQLSAGAQLCSPGFPAIQDAIPPSSYEYHVSHGVLSGKGGPNGWWTTDMPSNPGESGAPVFDRDGGVVALKYGGDEKAQNINVIIPINLASDLLITANVPLPTANAQPAPAPHPDDKSLDIISVSSERGTCVLADFLTFLSTPELKVTMDADTARDLSRRNIKIRTEGFEDVPLRYVLDHILLPQLPGPEQWTYEIVGKTVMIMRRAG